MIKTQVQLPDELYRVAKELARKKEWSLAELVRRALEAVICCFPDVESDPGPWRLPDPRPLGGDAFFENPDWRYDLHEARGMVREARGRYKSSPRKKHPS
ncbi:MAG: antitoxin [Kiritimatiellae bacterium]|nr:antitoxin [Kiritimatiellia bacterium]